MKLVNRQTSRSGPYGARFRWLVYTLALGVSLASASPAQTSGDEDLCDRIAKPVLAPFSAAEVTRQAGLPGECRLAFRPRPDTRVMISVLKHETVKQSRREFREHYEYIIPAYDRKRWSIRMQSRFKWSDIKVIRRDYPDHAMFLRTGLYTITVLTDRIENLAEIEGVLGSLAL